MKMLKADQVAERIGYSRAALYAKVAQGAFPRGKKMGAANRWPDYVVDAWNILFWNLNEPLPSMADETLEEIMVCVDVAKEGLGVA